MSGQPQPGSLRSRVLHVFSLYTQVDAPLIARALRQPTRTVTALLHSVPHVEAQPGRHARRPLVRTLYRLRPAVTATHQSCP